MRKGPLFRQARLFRVDVWDNSTLIGSVEFLWNTLNAYTCEVPFIQVPSHDIVWFELWVLDVGPPVAPELAPVAESGTWIFLGKQSAPVECVPVVPGCDTRIAMTDNAVVGLFVADALTYWEPVAGSSTTVTITAANTAWVLGMDASGAYYKIVWVCDYLWVAVGAMGPNPDAAWNSTPLPATVVE